jgi:hypothetical protein
MNKRSIFLWSVVAVAVAGIVVLFVEGRSRESGFVKCHGHGVDFTIALDSTNKITVSPDNGDKKHQKSRGKLRWSGPAGFGLEFDLDPQNPAGPGAEPGKLPRKKTKPTTGDLCYRVGKGPYGLKYTVTVPGATGPLDPRIIVDP